MRRSKKMQAIDPICECTIRKGRGQAWALLRHIRCTRWRNRHSRGAPVTRIKYLPYSLHESRGNEESYVFPPTTKSRYNWQGRGLHSSLEVT